MQPEVACVQGDATKQDQNGRMMQQSGKSLALEAGGCAL